MRVPTLHGVRWTLLIPVKALPAAKSRLRGAATDVPAHEQLVRAIRADTCAAARAATAVARLVLVTDRPMREGSLACFAQTRPGLNTGLREAAAHAARQWPADGVAVLVGDLPALRTRELDDALAVAAAHGFSYVADRVGTGTTLLTAAPEQTLRPQFGRGSAARHHTQAVAIAAGPGLRHDVDTPDDLRDALRLGVGARTRVWLAAGHAAAMDRFTPA